jgi:tetratricopeptide (TPR) repeat protein
MRQYSLLLPATLMLCACISGTGCNSNMAESILGSSAPLTEKEVPAESPLPEAELNALKNVPLPPIPFKVVSVAPPPPPTERPMIGPETTDRYGYPHRTADRIGLLALLREQKYDQLNEYMESFQRDFEADFRNEYWPYEAALSFTSPDPALEPLLNEWITKYTSSSVAYSARGAYFHSVAWEYRGGKVAKEVAQKKFVLVHRYMALAEKDYRKALELNPKNLTAYSRMMGVALLENWSDGKSRETLKAALTACPACFIPRIDYLVNLLPRWGGTLERYQQAVDEFVGARELNPKLASIKSMPSVELCRRLTSKKDYNKALTACDMAVASGEFWRAYYRRAIVYRKLRKLEKAATDAEKGLLLRPQDLDLQWGYFYTLTNQDRVEEAAAVLLNAARQGPADSNWIKNIPRFSRNLMWDADMLVATGYRDKALTYYDYAIALLPDNLLPQKKRKLAEAGGDPSKAPYPISPDDSPDYAQLLRTYNNPTQFSAFKKLDQLLAPKRKFSKITKHWDRFIEINPDHGRAYLERGGAYFHLKKLTGAHSDATKACELGVTEGCTRARQIAPMIR